MGRGCSWDSRTVSRIPKKSWLGAGAGIQGLLSGRPAACLAQTAPQDLGCRACLSHRMWGGPQAPTRQLGSPRSGRRLRPASSRPSAGKWTTHHLRGCGATIRSQSPVPRLTRWPPCRSPLPTAGLAPWSRCCSPQGHLPRRTASQGQGQPRHWLQPTGPRGPCLPRMPSFAPPAPRPPGLPSARPSASCGPSPPGQTAPPTRSWPCRRSCQPTSATALEPLLQPRLTPFSGSWTQTPVRGPHPPGLLGLGLLRPPGRPPQHPPMGPVCLACPLCPLGGPHQLGSGGRRHLPPLAPTHR
mmetsp:Transcript_56938/g.101655  ORF Transcript_56938/g.101655 Transcript_56938/m.101655 type:complete len:299 (-) Transcript_56938:2554-3450(-)